MIVGTVGEVPVAYGGPADSTYERYKRDLCHHVMGYL